MKILVDSSNYFLDNKNYGDIAMFCMLSRRLRQMWPSAEIHLVTLDPQLIGQHVPGVRPLVLSNRHRWQLFPPAAMATEWYWRRRRRAWQPLAEARRNLPHYAELADKEPDVERFLALFHSADLVMATGGGYFSDMFPEHACGILDTLAGAVYFGVPAVMMGAGFEEVRDPSLCAKASAVLPRLNFVACREGLFAPQILRSFGVSPRRIHVIGDEALAISHEARAPQLGLGIGVNLRQAEYSGVSRDALAAIAPALARAAEFYAAPLLPVPISMFGPSDCDSIRALISPYDSATDGGKSLDTLPKLLEQVSRCRLVVTGSYHAAVFALAQGVSVVALARSLHYATKLGGLQAEFGDGCKVVPLDAPHLAEHLAEAIDSAWLAADEQRAVLFAAARRQIKKCNAAYRKLRWITL